MKANITKTVINSPSSNIESHDHIERNLKVAYILRVFPHITETFILREMYWIRKHEIDLSIFALYPPPDPHRPVHEQANELLPNTHYSLFFGWNVIKAQFHFIVHSPIRYFRTLFKTGRQLYREPRVLLMALAIFPKSIYFALQMNEIGIQHIHAHFVWLEGIAARIIASMLDIPYSIRPHAFGLFRRNQKNVRKELEDASKIITISTFNQTYIADLCPNIAANEVDIVYCGLETDDLRPPLKRAGSKPIRILSIGRFIEKKGHEYLIDACGLLAEREISFECHIVGGGFNENRLQARVERLGLQDQVTLLGALDQNQILEFYRTSDIFVLACVTAQDGDRDGIPIVLMEAMSCELPVITTPLTGIPDLIHNEETGLFVEERDAIGLANSLERLIFNKDMRQHLGKKARQAILKKFEIRHNVAQLASIFRQVSYNKNLYPYKKQKGKNIDRS